MTSYEEIGKAFVNALCAASAVGHSSAAGLADYVPAGESDNASSLVVSAFACARLDDRALAGQEFIADWLLRSPLAIESIRRGAEAAGRIG